MALFAIDLIVGLCSVYIYTRLSALPKNVDPRKQSPTRSAICDSIISHLRFLLPSRNNLGQKKVVKNGKNSKKKSGKNEVRLLVQEIVPEVFTAFYYGTEFDIMLSMGLLILLNTIFGMTWNIFVSELTLTTLYVACTTYVALTMFYTIGINIKKGMYSGEGIVSLMITSMVFIGSLIVSFSGNELRILRFDLDNAYANLRLSLMYYMQELQIGNHIELPTNSALFKILISLLATTMVYTVLQSSITLVKAHMHLSDPMMKGYCNYQKAYICFSYVNIIMPFVIVFLSTEAIYDILPTIDTYELGAIKAWFTWLFIATRVLTLRGYLQSYLFYRANRAMMDDNQQTDDIKALQNDMLMPLKLIFVQALQLFSVPALLIALAVINHIRGTYNFTGKISDTLTYEQTKIHVFYGETINFLIWWIGIGLSLSTIFSILYFRNRKKDKPLAYIKRN
mmetsp:Transcript_7875/g.11683  ORF Transcript_7875/g.11683 Transcript_7875/m.11683 type:complete len:452 (+) Transcript_7875:171-1526(+)